MKHYFKKLIFRKPYPSFYFVNFAGWFLFIIANEFLMEFQYGEQMTLVGHSANILQWAAGFFITVFLRGFYKKLYYRKLFIWKKISVILFLSLLASLILFLVSQIIYSIYFYPNLLSSFLELLTMRNALVRLTQLFPILVAWSMLYFGIKLWIDITAEQERAERSDLLAQSSQLQMLRYQVNPHFLFNSFSALRALIRSNPKAAAEMVGKLSEFYRYSLITKSNSEVPLQSEIEALQFYADIEKIRFEENIEFSFNIDEKSEEFLIPSFIIHPLFENAIKYGLLTSETPLMVKVNSYLEEDTLIVQIMNSGAWYHKKNNGEKIGTGTGIKNIKDRLNLLFPNRYKLELDENNGFVSVILKLKRGTNEKI